MQELTPIENTFLGICAGLIEITAAQPLLYWKNAVQQKLPFTINPKYLYRGLAANAINFSVLCGIQFFGTGVIQQLIIGKNESNRKLTHTESLLAAFGGGVVSGFICGPLELIVVQQQYVKKKICVLWVIIEIWWNIMAYSISIGQKIWIISIIKRIGNFINS